MGAPAGEQLSLPDLDGAGEISLRQTTFVVVDLETTGGRMTAVDGKVADAITEIGAVKVRGGVVLGEFATLVDPQRSIPPQIVQLTGITTAMVCDAPISVMASGSDPSVLLVRPPVVSRSTTTKVVSRNEISSVGAQLDLRSAKLS